MHKEKERCKLSLSLGLAGGSLVDMAILSNIALIVIEVERCVAGLTSAFQLKFTSFNTM
jgi:hypothetical protein